MLGLYFLNTGLFTLIMKNIFLLILVLFGCQASMDNNVKLITVCDHIEALNEINQLISNQSNNRNSIKKNLNLLIRERNNILQSFNDRQFKLSDTLYCD